MYGWLITSNLKIDCLLKDGGRIFTVGNYNVWDHSLNKFPKDAVFAPRRHETFFLEGYILNKEELINKYSSTDWENAFVTSCAGGQIFSELRGAFSGFIYNELNGECKIYTDHVGNHAVYYYYHEGVLIAGTKIEYIVEVLKYNGIPIQMNKKGLDYMLTYGYMLDETTLVEEIKRVLPGTYIQMQKGIESTIKYYELNNSVKDECTEKEAIDKLDKAFRKAVQREFDKDREYGYRHLVDLSGGLDSRMVCWVAHEMGYTEQLNISYSKKDYLDEKISAQIAIALKHDYFFYPLDGLAWMMDIDENFSCNNGTDTFINITGGNRVLKNINPSLYGIEHTGMLGDVIISSYYADEEINYGKPVMGHHKYSDKLDLPIEDDILKRYSNLELFTLSTRGLIGIQSSYMIRQQYVETSSPFLDIDFLEVCLKLPFKYRKKHNIYLKWIAAKYPDAAEFGWESWHGIKPKKECVNKRRMVTLTKLVRNYLGKVIGRTPRDNMNPLDYWYNSEEYIRDQYELYYSEYVKHDAIPQEYRDCFNKMFMEGNVQEKAMVLTVLSSVKRWFSN